MRSLERGTEAGTRATVACWVFLEIDHEVGWLFRSFWEWVADQKVGKEAGLDRGRSQARVDSPQPWPRLQSSGGGVAVTRGEGPGPNYLMVIHQWMGTESLLLNGKTPGFLASEGDRFHLGPETRLDRSELLCNQVSLKYKGDREGFWHRHHKGTKEYPPPSL